EKGGEGGAGDREALKEAGEEAGVGGVQEDVEEVVAERGIAPEFVFEPERGMEERVVLLGGADFEPDADEAAERLQVGAGDVAGVVPDEAGGKGGPVGDERGEEEEGEEPAGKWSEGAAHRDGR